MTACPRKKLCSYEGPLNSLANSTHLHPYGPSGSGGQHLGKLVTLLPPRTAICLAAQGSQFVWDQTAVLPVPMEVSTGLARQSLQLWNVLL